MILKPSAMLPVYSLLLAAAMASQAVAFPATPEDDRYVDREFAAPGGHQWASWLISKLRREDALELPPYRLPIAGKRNSELTSVMMGFPKSMLDNGR